MPLNPHSESPELQRPPKEEPQEAVGQKKAEKLADLLWVRRNRVQGRGGGPTNPVVQTPEITALYGPAPRYIKPTHVTESLPDPNVIVLDDEDDGFGKVLDLYSGAVQGSALTEELDLAIWGDTNTKNADVDSEDASALGISILVNPPVQTPTGESRGLRIHTLEEYRDLIEIERGLAVPATVTRREVPPLGIEWNYRGCGYATGRVVNSRRAMRRR